MSIWGAVAGAAVGVIGSGIASKNNAKAQKDIAETPTRQTGIDLTSGTTTSDTTSSTDTSVLENVLNTESSINELMESLSQSQTQEEVTSILEEVFGTEVAQQISQLSSTGTTQETTEQVTERGDAASQQALQALIGDLGAGSDRMQTAIDAVLRSGLPAVSGASARAGTFDDTTTALLQNDLTARAAAAGLAAQDQQTAQLLQAIQAAQSGTETTTGTGLTEEQQQQQQQTDSTTQSQQTSGTTQETLSQMTSEQLREALERGEITSEQFRQATEATDTQTSTTQQEDVTNVSDTFTNPGDAVRPTGDLAQLVQGGDLAAALQALVAGESVIDQGQVPTGQGPITGGGSGESVTIDDGQVDSPPVEDTLPAVVGNSIGAPEPAFGNAGQMVQAPFDQELLAMIGAINATPAEEEEPGRISIQPVGGPVLPTRL